MVELPGIYPILERPNMAQVNPRAAGPKLNSQRLKTQPVSPPRSGRKLLVLSFHRDKRHRHQLAENSIVLWPFIFY